MRALITSFRKITGIDRPILFLLFGRGWSLVSGPVTISLIALCFTREMQGFYYTFASVMALQVFLEMGFSQSIIQFASHEFSKLSFEPGGQLKGDPEARSRLISLGRLALKWYSVLAVLVVICIGTGGHLFFSLKGTVPSAPTKLIATGGSGQAGLNWTTPASGGGASASNPDTRPPAGKTIPAWIVPWWLLVLAAGMNLALMPLWSLLEGCNQVSFIYACRTVSAFINSLALWSAMKGGAGLYCGAIASLVGVIVTAVVFLVWWRDLLRELLSPPQLSVISWRDEIWPFQWRIAISWMSGYFIFSLFNPVLFYFHGPVVAGQMGMTWQLVASLNAIAVSWSMSKASRMGILASERRHADMDRIFKATTIQATGACAFGGVILLLALAWLQGHYEIGTRFLTVDCAFLLVLATVANQVTTSQAVYLRAHKQEPFLTLSLVNGLVVGIAVILMGRAWAAWGACLAYAVVQVSLVPFATLIWQRCRKEWHKA